MIPCIILGGGRGERMRPATDTIPKPLLPVNGEPFARLQLRWLRAQGVTDIIYSIGYRGQQIRDELGDEVTYVAEDEPLGTGGAVRLAVEQTGLTGLFYVLYGDSWPNLNLSDLPDGPLLTVYREPGNVHVYRGRVLDYRRGTGYDFVDHGLCRLDSAWVALPPRRDLGDSFPGLPAYETSARYHEIGSPQGLADLELHLRDHPDPLCTRPLADRSGR